MDEKGDLYESKVPEKYTPIVKELFEKIGAELYVNITKAESKEMMLSEKFVSSLSKALSGYSITYR